MKKEKNQFMPRFAKNKKQPLLADAPADLQFVKQRDKLGQIGIIFSFR